jgi:hypothetical protein
MSDELEKIINNDKIDHPECYYSRSNSQRCNSTKEGRFVCDTLNYVRRVCEGVPPVEIYSYKETSEVPSIPSKVIEPFGNFDLLFGFKNLFKDENYEKSKIEYRSYSEKKNYDPETVEKV